MRMFSRGPNDTCDRDLSWLDWSMPTQVYKHDYGGLSIAESHALSC
jgi:hypothetical protein